MWNSFDRRIVGRLALLWWAGANLRIALLAVPPVIPLIHEDLHLDATQVGALSGMPVLLFAIAAVTGSLLVARIGARRALVVGLLIVGVASASRGAGPTISTLFSATFVMAVGIAMMQPAMPAVVRVWCPASIGLATAVYANGLLVGEILGAGLTIPLVLPAVGGSWSWAFVIWALPAIVTAVAILRWTSHREGAAQRKVSAWWPDWRSGPTWRIGLVLGGASSMYFTANAFIPDLLEVRGERDQIAAALFSLNVGQLPASLLMTLFPTKLMSRRRPLMFAAVAGASGVVGLLQSSGIWIVLWAGTIGFAAAFILIWTLALPPMIAHADEVPRMSAGIFTVGYAWSFVSPLVGGAWWDLTDVPELALAPALIAIVVMLAAATGIKLPARGEVAVGER